MTSKWIEEAMSKFPTGNDVYWDSEGMREVLERIDALLRLAKQHVDSDVIYQMIEKETFDPNSTVKLNEQELKEIGKRIGTGRTITGVSSVVPITDEEAERIFNETEGVFCQHGERPENCEICNGQ